jgi:REP element-mobilizing transposase RayT
MRLRGYDYSLPGLYFVTICTAGRALLFGEVMGGTMRLNEAGRIVQAVWADLPKHYARMEIEACMVMPNHIHGIIVLQGAANKSALGGAGLKPAPTNRHGLPEIVRGFKTFSARRVNAQRNTSGPLWQRGYYEHIIRHGESLDRIRRYIFENPARWAFDRENPQAVAPEPEDAWGRI